MSVITIQDNGIAARSAIRHAFSLVRLHKCKPSCSLLYRQWDYRGNIQNRGSISVHAYGNGNISQIRIAVGTNFNVNQAAFSLYDNKSYPNPSLLTMAFGGVPIFDPSNPGNNPLALTVINVNGGKRMITAGSPYWLSVSPGLPMPTAPQIY